MLHDAWDVDDVDVTTPNGLFAGRAFNAVDILKLLFKDCVNNEADVEWLDDNKPKLF